MRPTFAILEEIQAWLDDQNPLPRSAFGKAHVYLRNNWKRLTHFVENPEIWIGNNPTERTIRAPVVGRKNFAGCRSERGMDVAAMLYTIFETAKICAIDPVAERNGVSNISFISVVLYGEGGRISLKPTRRFP